MIRRERNNNLARFFKFSQNGSFLTGFTSERDTSPHGLAIDQDGQFYKANNEFLDSNFQVERYSSSGVDLGKISSAFNFPPAREVAVDPVSGSLYIATSDYIQIYQFDHLTGDVLQTGSPTCVAFDSNDGCPPTETFGSGDLTSAAGIAIDPNNGRTYVSDSGQVKVFDRLLETVPTLTSGQPTSLSATSVTLNAKVDPENIDVTDCHFDYVTDAQFQVDQFASADSVPCDPAPGSGSGDVAVSADVSGLDSSTVYHFRIVASNADPCRHRHRSRPDLHHPRAPDRRDPRRPRRGHCRDPQRHAQPPGRCHHLPLRLRPDRRLRPIDP